jgi:hypothetical protein
MDLPPSTLRGKLELVFWQVWGNLSSFMTAADATDPQVQARARNRRKPFQRWRLALQLQRISACDSRFAAHELGRRERERERDLLELLRSHRQACGGGCVVE